MSKIEKMFKIFDTQNNCYFPDMYSSISTSINAVSGFKDYQTNFEIHEFILNKVIKIDELK